MSDLGLALRQVRFTNKAFWRNPASAFFTFVFPLMFLVIFTALFGNDRGCPPSQLDCPPADEISVSTIYVPAIAAFSIISATYTNLAISVSFSRDQGVLKRVQGSPIPGWTYLFGRIIHAILVSFLLVVLVAAFGAAFYSAEVPTETLGPFLLTVVVGAATFSALGLALTAAIPNADAAPPIVNGSILPLLFLSGIFIPIRDPDAWYVTVAKIFPVYHFANSMNTAYFPAGESAFQTDDLLIMGAWLVAGIVLSVLFFSWEPRR